ncbi:MptD family putative ECF transporter S component [Actinomyces israelii]|mgnify:FL=1|uniref:MptD family putative ECF transporter S component n=1 Tax=Actinomyces israelii TaxID=1659 RepID=A0ABT4IBU9_9ACTO|nr:MptD family putative ECF transporter S component [Actinomyces israelii]MCZ0859210.1 MptD family putative ECF transporter S component [Actinomyces israelii]
MSTETRNEDVRENPHGGSSPRKPAASTRLGTRDLITLGVYSVLYVVVMFIAGMPFAFSPVLTYALPVSAAFFCAPVYLLLVAKVPRRGAVAILGAVVGLVLFVTGMFWLWAVAALVLGVAAGEIAALGRFRSPGLNTVSYVVLALAPLASYVMVWINQQSYRAYLVGKGTDDSYMNTMIAAANQWLLVAIVVGTLLAAWLGTLLGRRMLARHFTRAGIVA